MTMVSNVFLIPKSIFVDHLFELGLMEPHNTSRDDLMYGVVKLTTHWLEPQPICKVSTRL